MSWSHQHGDQIAVGMPAVHNQMPAAILESFSPEAATIFTIDTFVHAKDLESLSLWQTVRRVRLQDDQEWPESASVSILTPQTTFARVVRCTACGETVPQDPKVFSQIDTAHAALRSRLRCR